MRLSLFLLSLALGQAAAFGQFDLQQSGTTSSLRGIDSLGAGVAWASGTDGTVIHTEDGGHVWQRCAVPPGAEKLDFRGVQAFNAQVAVAMSSGKGGLSRIYRTTDGCRTWKLTFTNPDADGFFDAIRKVTERQMYLLGDPVGGKFAMFYTPDQGITWYVADDAGLDADKSDGAFAASNSALASLVNVLFFGTGGSGAAHVYVTAPSCRPGLATDAACPMAWHRTDVPMAAGSAASGIFSIAARVTGGQSGKLSTILVAVGGNYEKPAAGEQSAAWSTDGGVHWNAATTLPGGYRSSVAYGREQQLWLAVGPSGADVSRDNGRTWKALEGETAAGWNAISLPFVVGPKGRVGRLTDAVETKK